jgi:hypothetical protein
MPSTPGSVKRIVAPAKKRRSCAMPTSFRNSFWAGLVAAFLLGVYLLRLWSAENQVRLHSEHLVHQVERRSWSAVENFVAADYHDQWNDDRPRLLSRLRLVGRFFFDLTITASDAHTEKHSDSGTWQARVQMTGRGEAASEITARVNSLTTPFRLTWRQQSWKPWDWQLVGVTNETLDLPDGDF